MAKQKIDESVSLFPFLDIMACLIGILVLLITAATLAQIGRDAEDTADAQAEAKAEARVTEYRAVRKSLIAQTEEQKQLQELVEQTEAARQELEQLQAEVARLEAQRAAAQQQIAEMLQPETEEKLEELQRQLVELRTLLANRKEAAESQIQIVPSGSGYGLAPVFVECAAGSVVLHDQDEPLQIPVGKLAAHKAYLNLLDNVKQQSKGTVVFLVRPDGAASYNTARNIARRRYVTNGKLAVAGHGKLDLSLFQK
ncbi:MAG: hypothetical protein ABIP48_00965 [Planctomycetota bacterium]